VSVHVTAPMLAAYKHFLAVGFTENGAAAPVGNGVQESGEFLVATVFRAHPDWSGGVAEPLKSGGFEEWLGDRKTALIAFIGRAEARLGAPKGSLLNDLGTQCDFVVYELQTNPGYATLYQQLTSGTRSIANLTSNFCWVYERPARATANVENRIAHAEAVVRVAGTMKAPQAPASPAPIPQIPVTHAPPSIPAPPGPPHELPPISATVAGRQSAVIENLLGVLDAYKTERASYLESIDKEISIVETTLADFGKLASLPATPPLQIPGADPAPTIPLQRRPSVFGITNWATTFSALPAVFSAGVGIFNAIHAGQAPSGEEWGIIGASISSILIGINAKDKNVTGGTVPATPEAKRRVGA
jgi:hypothetical protein